MTDHLGRPETSAERTLGQFVATDPYARCRACGSRKIAGIADAHAVGLVGRNGQLRSVTRFEESCALVDRASLMCTDCGSWNVRLPGALRR